MAIKFGSYPAVLHLRLEYKFQFFHVRELKVVLCYNSIKLYVCCIHHIDCFNSLVRVAIGLIKIVILVS